MMNNILFSFYIVELLPRLCARVSPCSDQPAGEMSRRHIVRGRGGLVTLPELSAYSSDLWSVYTCVLHIAQTCGQFKHVTMLCVFVYIIHQGLHQLVGTAQAVAHSNRCDIIA